jgi:hypothetical protein
MFVLSVILDTVLRHGLIIQTKEQIGKQVIIACFQYGLCGPKVRGGGMTSRDARGQRQAADTEIVGSL